MRVKLRIASVKAKASFEVNSLLNTGFGTEEPEVVVPIEVAERLSFYPKLSQGAIVKAYETAGGIARMYYIADAVEIQAITEDKNSKVIKCALVISELEREVLLSDQAIDELRVMAV
ncbi:hypothetical protein M1N08_01240 [Dehalococcoidia bacterium]|nr:hypothetical protein [Dehalococcoidia bacterium]